MGSFVFLSKERTKLFTLHPGGASRARASPQSPFRPLLALGTLPSSPPLLQQAHSASRVPWCPLWTGQGSRTCDWALEACPGPPSPTHCQGGLCPRWERGVQEGIFGPLLLLPEGRDELQALPGFSISATRFLVSRLRGLAGRLLETRPHPSGRLGPQGLAATGSLGSWEGPRTPAYSCLGLWERKPDPCLPTKDGSPARLPPPPQGKPPPFLWPP